MSERAADRRERAAARRDAAGPMVDDVLWFETLLDRIRSLRTLVAIVAIVAVAALGVALWALLGDRDRAADRAVRPARVSALEHRVDDLEREIRGAPSRADLVRLESALDGLDQRVAGLESRTASQGAGASPRRSCSG